MGASFKLIQNILEFLRIKEKYWFAYLIITIFFIDSVTELTQECALGNLNNLIFKNS